MDIIKRNRKQFDWKNKDEKMNISMLKSSIRNLSILLVYLTFLSNSRVLSLKLLQIYTKVILPMNSRRKIQNSACEIFPV